MKEHHRTDRLTWITIFFVIVIAVILLTYKAPRLEYDLPSAELLAELEKKEMLISVEEVENLLNDENMVFVDLRNKGEYFVSHISGAINVPVMKILDEQHIELFENTDKTFVLYGQNHLDANGTWMLLRQLGHQNIKMLLGGFTNYQNKGKSFPDYYASFEELSSSEFDLIKEISQRSDSIRVNDEAMIKEVKIPGTVKKAPVAKKKSTSAPAPAIPVVEEEEEEEGC